MKKIFTLLSITILSLSSVFCQCNPAIPATASVVPTSQSVSGSYKVFWVCNGVTATGTGSYCDYYLEPGATLMGTGSYAKIYVPAGATVNRSGGNYPTVYYVNAGDVISAGGATGQSLNPCASMAYNYANAPVPGCPLCNTAGTAPTSINSSSGNSLCPGKPTTLTQIGGILGASAHWAWYTGSCGGTPVDTGASIVVSPTSTVTYYVRGEDTCSTTCAMITLSPTGISIPVISGSPIPLCSGQSTTLSIINNPCFGSCNYYWSSGDTGITIVVNPTSGTTYTATVKNGCGDSTYSTITVPSCATGVGLLGNADGIRIFPNPSHGSFTLSMPLGLMERPSVKIINMLGDEIPFTSREQLNGYYKNEISIGSRPAGIYFVKVEDRGKIFVSKLILDVK